MVYLYVCFRFVGITSGRKAVVLEVGKCHWPYEVTVISNLSEHRWKVRVLFCSILYKRLVQYELRYPFI